MASPFNIFRRNQRIMMAALVAMSMFAFVFMDPSIMRGDGGLPKPLVVLLAAGICGIAAWFVGQRHGKSSEWGSIAALLGAIAAFFYAQSPAEEGAIQTSLGAFDKQELELLGYKRNQANQFVGMAMQKTNSLQAEQGFGPFDPGSMLQFKLGQAEAKRLGISLDDKAVNNYIRKITEDRMSSQQFAEILKEIRLSQGDLFKILQGELEVRLAMSVQFPLFDSWTDLNFQSGQEIPRFILPATPEEAWENFQKLNVRQSVSAVALPVEAFVKTLDDPAESELQAFFEARKNFRPGPQGEPGFVQPQRVRLAYLAAEFEKFESQAEPPTDEEVTEFYDQNRERRYRIHEFPDLPSDDDPADAAAPENVAPEIPEPTLPEEKSEESKDDAPPDEPKDEPKSDEKKDAGKEDDAPPEENDGKKPNDDESSAATSTPGIRLAAFVQEKEEQSSDAQADEENFPDDNPVSAEDAISESTDAEPLDIPPKPGDKPAEPPARYRPLDDTLRDEIQEEILKDRAFEKMGEAIAAAMKEMERLTLVYADAEEKDKSAAARSIVEDVQKYADEHGLIYVETKMLSRTEMQTSTKEDIGSAVLLTAGNMQFQARQTVVDDVFPQNGQESPLYYPQQADSPVREKRYAWWKIEGKPQHVPAWTDEGIPEQVKAGWKFDQGRTLAQQRAAELLELAQAEPDLSKAFAEQTVTGQKGSDPIVIKVTPRFSWFSTGSTVPSNDLASIFATPRLSFIDGIDQPGNDFMQVVFEKLKPGETGAAANYSRSVFYVVQPKDRDGTEPAPEEVEGFQTLAELREKFLNLYSNDRLGFAFRPYNLLMSDKFANLQQQWSRSFDARYRVETGSPDGGPPDSQQ